jgi:hypothetical protein
VFVIPLLFRTNASATEFYCEQKQDVHWEKLSMSSSIVSWLLFTGHHSVPIEGNKCPAVSKGRQK